MLQSSLTGDPLAGALPSGFSAAPLPLTPQPDLPALNFRLESWRSEDDLIRHEAAWKRLAETSVERNPFYEFAGLTAAWRHLRNQDKLEVLTVWAAPRVCAAGSPVLCGLFPIRRLRGLAAWPCRSVELWRHSQCFLTTPLIRADVLKECWRFFMDALRDQMGIGLLHLPMHHSGGPVQQTITQWQEQLQMPFLVKRWYQRALLQRDGSAEAYFRNQISKKTRNELARLRRKLENERAVQFHGTEKEESIESWIENFLQLEQTGWKGAAGTALGCHAPTRQFFSQWIRESAISGDLQRIDLHQGDRLIASKVNLMAGMTGYAFKIAYDPEFHHYSPGRLLEMENIARFHDSPRLLEMDSCADPDHSMIDHLWSGRRDIQSLLIGTGLRGSELALSTYPLIRWGFRSSRYGLARMKNWVRPTRLIPHASSTTPAAN